MNLIESLIFKNSGLFPEPEPPEGIELGALFLFKRDEMSCLKPLKHANRRVDEALETAQKCRTTGTIIDALNRARERDAVTGNYHGIPWIKVLSCPRDDKSLGELFPLEAEYVRLWDKWFNLSSSAQSTIEAEELS